MDIYPRICLLLNLRALGMLLYMTCLDRICDLLDMLLRILLWQNRYPERIVAGGMLDILIHKSSPLDLCMFYMLSCRCKWVGMFYCSLHLCKDQLLDRCLHISELELYLGHRKDQESLRLCMGRCQCTPLSQCKHN